MKISGAQIVVETLIEQETKVIFGYPGGQVLNIYDALYGARNRIKHILTAHEQGAAHAADGYARATGKVGVVLATSGPGATNLVTGIANAYLDSVPLVAITGNVPCSLIGRDSFQEVDIVGITMPIVKHNYIVKDITELADTIREAFRIAKSGRPGPVLIDIPKDVQIAETEFSPKGAVEPYPKKPLNFEKINEAAEMINASKRPYIYAGGGIVTAGAGEETAQLAELIDAPIGCSLMGIGAVSSENKRNLGMTGMHGSYTANKAKMAADLVVAVGVRFSDRATGKKDEYLKDAKIIHIDIDPCEIDKNIPSQLGIEGDVKDVLDELIKKVNQKHNEEWMKKISDLKKYEDENSLHYEGRLNAYEIIECVNKLANSNTPVATDVGQHQMWTAQKYSFTKTRRFITSGGLGTMGFGMGAAIGASVGTGEKTVLFTGDGSFGMNLNELATAVKNDVPLVIVLLNNGVLGMVRQWQTMFYNEHYSETTLERKTDFVKLAEAFGAKGLRITKEDELESVMKEAFDTHGTVVVDCHIDMDDKVFPMIPPNKAVSDLILK